MYVETRARQALLYRGVIPMVVYTDGGAFSEEETLQHAAGYVSAGIWLGFRVFVGFDRVLVGFSEEETLQHGFLRRKRCNTPPDM